MIVLKMTLASAITHKQTDLGTLVIVNDGTGSDARGSYRGKTLRKNGRLDSAPVRQGSVRNHARKAEPVWSLVRKMLVDMGY